MSETLHCPLWRQPDSALHILSGCKHHFKIDKRTPQHCMQTSCGSHMQRFIWRTPHIVHIDNGSKARLASHDLQTPEIATNRTLPEWFLSRRIPATHRLNLSRPDAILFIPVRAQASQVPATRPRIELRSGVGRGRMGQHLASAPASTARPRICQPNQLTPSQ